MDVSEDELFESFVITDKSLTGKNETLIDAYAFIDTENPKEKQLHIFQYKIGESNNHSVSPKEVNSFATLIDNEFLHPELAEQDSQNEAINEIKRVVENFLSKRGNKVYYKCHYITNSSGITPKNKDAFSSLLQRFAYDKQTKGFDVQIYGIDEISDLAKNGKISVGLETLEFEKDCQEAYRYEDNSNKVEIGLPGKVFIGMLNINELIRLQNKYHRNQLYSENIRLYLGNRGVNKDIIATITSEESQWFPYMNNGISIICDKLSMGTPNNKRISIDVENMQIINGCQTVNALYNAKYSAETKDEFNSSKVLVKIYQISPIQTKFKLAIIKATNNQNAVTSYALVSNDPIQIAIQNKLKILGYIYDRKGESKQLSQKDRVVSMSDGAIAYKAIYQFEARKLRSGVGKGKIFKNNEYKHLYKPSYLENDGELTSFSVKLLLASKILSGLRVLISKTVDIYIKKLPIFKKSLYYVAGLFYAQNASYLSKLEANLVDLIKENNPQKIKNINWDTDLDNYIHSNFEKCIDKFIDFYNTLKNVEKDDIDNLLKNANFEKQYLSIDCIKEIYEISQQNTSGEFED